MAAKACWCIACCTGHSNDRQFPLPRRLPEAALSDYDYYMDTHKLRISASNMKNANSRAELERIKTTVLQNLSKLPAVPSVGFQDAPPLHEKVSLLWSVLLRGCLDVQAADKLSLLKRASNDMQQHSFGQHFALPPQAAGGTSASLVQRVPMSCQAGFEISDTLNRACTLGFEAPALLPAGSGSGSGSG